MKRFFYVESRSMVVFLYKQVEEGLINNAATKKHPTRIPISI